MNYLTFSEDQLIDTEQGDWKFKLKPKETQKEFYPLKKAILNWTRNNYLQLVESNSDIAKSCMVGSLSFDENNNRIVKTYIRFLSKEEPKEYLDLIKI